MDVGGHAQPSASSCGPDAAAVQVQLAATDVWRALLRLAQYAAVLTDAQVQAACSQVLEQLRELALLHRVHLRARHRASLPWATQVQGIMIQPMIPIPPMGIASTWLSIVMVKIGK